MNEKVENLILEHLRAMRADVSSINEEIRGMRGQMRAMKQHMAGFMTQEINQYGALAELKHRVGRIGNGLS